MEKEFSGVDENDPKAMARMMRKMSEMTGEKIDGEMEEVVRKLEEGADPDSLEEQLGGVEKPEGGDPYGDDMGMGGMGGMGSDGSPPKNPKEAKHRFKPRPRSAVIRCFTTTSESAADFGRARQFCLSRRAK